MLLPLFSVAVAVISVVLTTAVGYLSGLWVDLDAILGALALVVGALWMAALAVSGEQDRAAVEP